MSAPDDGLLALALRFLELARCLFPAAFNLAAVAHLRNRDAVSVFVLAMTQPRNPLRQRIADQEAYVRKLERHVGQAAANKARELLSILRARLRHENEGGGQLEKKPPAPSES